MSEIISGSDGFIVTDKCSDCTRQGYKCKLNGRGGTCFKIWFWSTASYTCWSNQLSPTVTSKCYRGSYKQAYAVSAEYVQQLHNNPVFLWDSPPPSTFVPLTLFNIFHLAHGSKHIYWFIENIRNIAELFNCGLIYRHYYHLSYPDDQW